MLDYLRLLAVIFSSQGQVVDHYCELQIDTSLRKELLQKEIDAITEKGRELTLQIEQLMRDRRTILWRLKHTRELLAEL